MAAVTCLGAATTAASLGERASAADASLGDGSAADAVSLGDGSSLPLGKERGRCRFPQGRSPAVAASLGDGVRPLLLPSATDPRLMECGRCCVSRGLSTGAAGSFGDGAWPPPLPSGDQVRPLLRPSGGWRWPFGCAWLREITPIRGRAAGGWGWALWRDSSVADGLDGQPPAPLSSIPEGERLGERTLARPLRWQTPPSVADGLGDQPPSRSSSIPEGERGSGGRSLVRPLRRRAALATTPLTPSSSIA